MKTIIGLLVVAAVATVGDFIWYTDGVRHTIVAGRRGDPVRTRRTESARSRRPDSRSAGGRGTPARRADADGFGSCSNEGECQAVCPKEIPISNIARMTREYLRAVVTAAK